MQEQKGTDLHTQQSPGETSAHLFVSSKSQNLSFLPHTCVCTCLPRERYPERHCVTEVEITLRSTTLLFLKPCNLYHQQASHVVS